MKIICIGLGFEKTVFCKPREGHIPTYTLLGIS